MLNKLKAKFSARSKQNRSSRLMDSEDSLKSSLPPPFICAYGSSDFLDQLKTPKNTKPEQNLIQLDKAFANKLILKCHEHVLAILLSDGSIYTYGGFPDTKISSKDTHKITSLDAITVKDVEVGGTHMFVINNQGNVYGWGLNDRFQLGSEEMNEKPKLLKSIPLNNKVVSISCGFNHSLFLLSDGSVWSSGSNSFGQLGYETDSISKQSVMARINSINGIPFRQVVAGYFHSLVLTYSGVVFAWGKNSHGQLGTGDRINKPFPTRVNPLKHQKVRYIAAGKNHTVALTLDGGVFTFGSNEYGQLGHGKNSGDFSVNPRKIFELMGTTVTQIACGKNHTIAFVGESSHLYTFGNNYKSQLGYTDTSPDKNYNPFLVTGPWSSKTQQPSLTNFDMRVHTVVAGGNSTVVNLALKICAKVDQRVLSTENNDSEISMFTDSFVKELCGASESDFKKPKMKSQIETLKEILSSQSCLNVSFLAEDHDKTQGSYPGVNMMKARLIFSKLGSSKSKAIEQTMKDALTNELFPSLTQSPPDIEVLRLYLVLPECHLFQKSGMQEIPLRFAEKVLGLKNNASKVLDKWYNSLEPMFFNKLVETYKQVVFVLLKEPQAYNRLQFDLGVSFNMLDKLYKINFMNEPIIPYQKFYLKDVNRYINLKTDYDQWIRKLSRTTLCSFPFLLDSKVKTEILQIDAHHQKQIAFNHATERNLGAIFGLTGGGYLESPRLEITVNRSDIVTKTLNQLSNYHTSSLKKPLLVKFEGEEGEDAGGIRKEFFMLILKEILDPKYGMFESYEESRLMWFSDYKGLVEDQMYFLVGIVLGLAIYNDTIIDISFPKALYKKLLGESVDMSDLKELDPTLYKNFQELLNYDEEENGGSVEDVFCLTFSIDKDNFGKVVTVNLVENGSEKNVTKSNRAEYVNAYIEYLFNTSVQEPFKAFKTGFLKVCGGEILNLFKPTELMEMVIGNQNYNWEDLEKNTEYKGVYYRQHKVINMFWNVFHDFDVTKKKKFLLFLTGSDKVPITGLKIIIQSVKLGDTHLPVAHTCFNLLDLPQYSSTNVMRTKLSTAINYNQEFHLV